MSDVFTLESLINISFSKYLVHMISRIPKNMQHLFKKYWGIAKRGFPISIICMWHHIDYLSNYMYILIFSIYLIINLDIFSSIYLYALTSIFLSNHNLFIYLLCIINLSICINIYLSI